MAPVVAGYRTDIDLIKMKFLILSLFVCAVSAAPYEPYKFKPYQPAQYNKPVQYKPYQPAKQVTKTFTQKTVAAPVIATAQVVATAPVVAAQTVYGAARVGAPAVPKPYTAGKDSEAEILRLNSEVTKDGYVYNYETANGIAQQASGVMKTVNGVDYVASQGSYRYTAPDGSPVEISYIADENGYQPQGNVLPVAPPTPEAILRSLEYIRTHPQKTENY